MHYEKHCPVNHENPNPGPWLERDPAMVNLLDLGGNNNDKTNTNIENVQHVDSSVYHESVPRDLPTNMSLPRSIDPADVDVHLRPLVTDLDEELAEGTIHQLAGLVQGYSDVFVGPDGKLGRTNLIKHDIDTGDARPIKQGARRFPIQKEATASTELHKQLDSGTAKDSSSPWASPIVLVAKKDGSTRFCVDYRKLNNITKKDAYPLPRIDDSLDSLAGAKWFVLLT
jgi:hypothetical protein